MADSGQTVRIATVNVNGIRAAYRRGMADWLAPRGVDLLCLQEVRAPDKITRELLDEDVWDVRHTEAAAKGRAGVAIATRRDAFDGALLPVESRVGIGEEYFDDSGRWIENDVRLPNGQNLTLVSAYVHSGEVDTLKQEDKYRFLEAMLTRLPQLAERSDHALVVGDLNVGHTELDIKNWKGNVKNAGFLPEERAYFDRFFGDVGYVDVARSLAGDVPGPYTWWSYRGKAFDTDAGWRIDYQMATPGLAALAAEAVVDRADSYDTRFSDHAPLVVDYRLA
ncbi:MAG: exodeoxyribonuclease III [Kocuria sp.]|uniref:exodeoxyribonuclease III n=1 Tax=Kocuria TaxID=57493 RepID=UPI0006D772A8|nr:MULTISPECIES: exodeoxyribonuclease III [Kocuria]MBS6029653.1 exodeoxyribonuclease III [Kocuria rhizophila]MDN5630274.1 exodeoxyribonuclease III [Kocuria sp.]MDO4257653.1 exodeoxyribonuclease III [Kocuria sp.]WNB87841.1 exodeoxyribonuclease III [Glutamicibacter protophormiae]